MSRSSFVFGLLFVALGIVLLLDEAGSVEAWEVVEGWWPTVLVTAGVAQWVTRPRNPVGGAVLVTVGVGLLAWTLDLIESLALLWPVLLIGLGIWLLTGRGGTRGSAVPWEGEVVAVFDDRRVSAPAGPWGGQSITAVFGDVELDLREARLAEGSELQVTTVFGDVRLAVPPDWRLVVSGPELFGEVRLTSTDEAPAHAPVLKIRVALVFGDLRVRASTAPGAERPW